VRTKTDEVKTTDVAIVILAVNFTDVAVTIGTHENVELLPYCIHGWLVGSLSVSVLLLLSLSVVLFSIWNFNLVSDEKENELSCVELTS
jgi:hypothetical protein